MSVGKGLARATVNTVGSVFGIAGALVNVVGDFASGLVESVDGELMPREDSETNVYLKAIVAGMHEFKATQDKINEKLESLDKNQSSLEEKLAELTARLEALEGKNQQAE